MSQAVQVIHTGDWHFDGLKNHFPSDHADRIGFEVEKVYKYAVKKAIPYIIVAGDISDSYKMTAESIQKLIAILSKYDKLITTFYLMGNHDYGDNKTSSLSIFQTMVEFKMLKNFVVVDQREIRNIDGINFNFCPFPFTELLPSNKPAVNIIHRDVQGAVGDNGRDLKVKEDLVVNSQRDFTVSGHIHLRQFLKKLRVLYPGALFQKTFGESLPKGFAVVKYKVKNGVMKADWEYVDNLPKFRLETVHITNQKEFAALRVDPNIRYRLYVADGIVVPSKLRQDVPNIDQLWGVKGKKLEADLDYDQNFLKEVSELPKIDPMLGLKDFYKANKLKKEDFIFGKKAVADALRSLGY